MFAACTLAVSPLAHAEKDKATPWAVGVSKSDQSRALELFKTGNDFFAAEKYTEALAEYEKALPIWDHPTIEYNVVVCLVQIRQPLQAWDHLEKALKYGDAPLGKHVYDEAVGMKKLLDATLAQVEIESDQDEVEVQLDGKTLFTGKHKKMLHLLAGTHQLAATRDGYVTESKALDLPAGKMTHEDIELEPEKVKVKVTEVRENYERRWSWYVPWTAAAGSVALALAGTGVYLEARNDIHGYDSALAAKCPTGCTASQIPATLTAQETHAQHVSQIGIGLWSAGGVVAVAAGVMAIMNRPRMIEGHPDVAIIATPNFVGASVALTFR